MKKRRLDHPVVRHGYIAVEGPIGVGKTSLARLLSKELNGRVVLEETESNPFLKDFYRDRRKYAFQTQIFFLLSRYQQQKELAQMELFKEAVIADYIFAKDRIFAWLNLNEKELALYEQIYRLLDGRLVKPDLVIFLQATPEVLMERIKRRDKEYEREMDVQYIHSLVQAYNRFFFHYDETPLLVVDTSEIDFVNRQEDFVGLLREIASMGKGVRHFIPRLGTR